MLTILATTLCLSITSNVKDSAANLRFLQLIDTQGKVQRLAENADRKGTAFVFLAPHCPRSPEAIATLNQMMTAATAQNLAIYGVVADATATRQEAVELAKKTQATFPILFDATGELAAELRPSKAPEAILIDAKGDVVYRGRIEERKEGAAPNNHLLNAMTALASNATIAVTATEPEGCDLELPSATQEVTFARHIAPILYANCAECHRPGQVAPFALLSYDDAAKRADFLADVTGSRLMPPWRAEIDYGHFEDERRLTDRQVELLAAWAAAGAPKGVDSDLPPVPVFAEGWRLGEPDLVVEAPVPYTVPADGPDVFQHFVIPIEIPEDKTLIGFEYRPSNPVVAHHAVIFLDSTGRAREKDAQTPEPGFRTSGSVEGSVSAFVGVWTPGMTPRYYPEGIGIRVPKKIDVVLQMHLHPSGKEEVEQSKIALYFSDKPETEIKRQQMLLLGSLAIDIPPGAPEHRLGSTLTLPIDMTLLSVFPHLHLIGKEMKVTATLPNGDSLPLIWIKDWNFYWQDSYLYKEPITLPKGTTIRVEAAYNNSEDNPFNPSSPPKRVLFGNGSADEMCFAFFQFVTDERQSMVRLGPALMQSMLSEWRKADIDPEAREHIIDEAGKLFGQRGTEALRRILALSGGSSKKETSTDETKN